MKNDFLKNDFFVEVLKSKLHRAKVTASNVNYEGSLSISADLMKAVGIFPHEKVLCGNQSSGARFETYVIPAKSGKGEIILNGATARLGQTGDLLTIMTFARIRVEDAQDWQPRIIVLSGENHLPNV